MDTIQSIPELAPFTRLYLQFVFCEMDDHGKFTNAVQERLQACIRRNSSLLVCRVQFVGRDRDNRLPLAPRLREMEFVEPWLADNEVGRLRRDGDDNILERVVEWDQSGDVSQFLLHHIGFV